MSTALAKTLNMHFWRGWVLDLPKWWSTFVTVFLSIFSEAFPFLMLGSALAAAVHLYVPEKIIVKIIGKKGISRYIAAGFAGLIFPVCECAIVPIGGSLIRKKVPPSVVVSFMAAAPVVNPLVALSTLAAFNGELRVVFARVGLAFVVAVLQVFSCIVSVLTGFRQFGPARNTNTNMITNINTAILAKEASDFFFQPLRKSYFQPVAFW